MVSLLGDTSLLQQDILVKQQESLEHQLQLKDSQSTLQEGIDLSVSSVGQLGVEIEHSAKQQQELLVVISNARKDFAELLHMMEERTKVSWQWLCCFTQIPKKMIILLCAFIHRLTRSASKSFTRVYGIQRML